MTALPWCHMQVYGDPHGKHLGFWFHGTPSSRLEAHGLSEKLLKQLSLKVRGGTSQILMSWMVLRMG